MFRFVGNELRDLLDAENVYIEEMKAALKSFNDSMSEKAERDMRIGFRTKGIMDLRLARHRNGENPVLGKD